MTAVIVHPDGTTEPAIRSLTQEERDVFSEAVIRSYLIVPAFRDAIALMRPFYDATADTAYTDRYSRVGLSSWFFNELDVFQRASVILHEAYHVLNNTFTRGEALNAEPGLSNVASDLEINSCLCKLSKIDLSFGILPDRKPFDFELFLTMEQYYHLIKQDKDLQDKLFPPPPSDPNCPVHGKDKGDKEDKNADTSGEKQDKTGGEQDNAGNEPSNGQSDTGGGSGGECAEDGGDNGNSGSGGSGGQGQSGSQGQSGQGHAHGDSGPQCSCPHEGQGQGKGQPGQGQGTTKGCDQATSEREEAADAAGVERASDAETNVAKKNTAVRMAEELKQARAAGKGEMAEFLNLALQHMKPPRVNWRTVFRRLVSKMEEAIVRGRSDYSYRRTSRRLTDSKFIFPGMVKYQPKILMGIDTSGSMSHEDHLAAASEIEGIMQATSRAKNSLKVFSVDTAVKNCKLVDNVRSLDLRGGGGTAMEVAWQFAMSLPKKERPDIFCLATDGYTDWRAVEKEIRESNAHFRSIILVTTEGGYKSVHPELHSLTHVIDISEGAR